MWEGQRKLYEQVLLLDIKKNVFFNYIKKIVLNINLICWDMIIGITLILDMIDDH